MLLQRTLLLAVDAVMAKACGLLLRGLGADSWSDLRVTELVYHLPCCAQKTGTCIQHYGYPTAVPW